MADLLKFFRVLALPADPLPDSIYLVKTGPDTADFVITGNDGTPHTAVKGPKGDTGADSTVPGPPGADSTVPGPPGADSTVPGPPGPPADTYEHLQSSPTDVWVVNHNFGRNPTVSVVDAAGREVEADVLHTSLNQLQVSFNLPATGKAIAR